MSGTNFGFSGATPPGVYVSDNIARALDYQRTHTAQETFNWFYSHVRNNRGEAWMSKWESMDYKQINPDYADFGNYNFGAVSAALGISEIVATCGAGWAQSMANGHSFPVSGALAALNILGSCGDNPEDTVQIRAGYAKGASYSIGSSMIEDVMLESIRSAIVPGYNVESALIADFLHNEVSAAGGTGAISINRDSAGNYTQIERDNLGNVVEVANFVLNGLGWDVVVTDKLGNVQETYYQPISAGASTAGREPITFFSIGTQTSFLRGAAYSDPSAIDSLLGNLFAPTYLGTLTPFNVSIVGGGVLQSQNYFSSSHLSVPSGVFDTSGNWFSWSPDSINQAARDLAAGVAASYANSATGDRLSFQVSQKPNGDWNVSLSGFSGNQYSPLMQKLLSTGQPSGMNEFLQWFQKRAESLARDQVVFQSLPQPGEGLDVSVDNLTAIDGTAPRTTQRSGNDEALKSKAMPMMSEWAGDSKSLRSTAALLTESMAQWSQTASNGAFCETQFHDRLTPIVVSLI